uniref:Peptidase_M14 domain-containing protein n=1 Tax=Steinernema glaseri TaxID=37863 RepID=A0A1I8A956_9BILA
MDIVDELGYRRDGRTAEQIRNVVFRLNAFPNADGSAYLEQGNTKVRNRYSLRQSPSEGEKPRRASSVPPSLSCTDLFWSHQPVNVQH